MSRVVRSQYYADECYRLHVVELERRAAGFTLLELLVVLVILSVMAGIAGFSLAAAPARRGDAAGSAARDRALRSGDPVLDTSVVTEQLHLPDGRTVPTLPWTADSMPQ